MNGAICVLTSTTRMPKIGSTIPDRLPITNALPRLIPSRRNGREIAAPSGKFCKPMPIASATAMPRYAVRSGPELWPAIANNRPTLIPSGMLCKVTAETSNVVRFQLVLTPSGSSPSI